MWRRVLFFCLILLVSTDGQGKKLNVRFTNKADVSFRLLFIQTGHTLDEGIDVGGIAPHGTVTQDTWEGHRFAVMPQAPVNARFEVHDGFLVGGGDISVEVMTVSEAKQRCKGSPSCQGFTFEGERTDNATKIFLKEHFELRPSPDNASKWTSLKRVELDGGKPQEPREALVPAEIVIKRSGDVDLNQEGQFVMPTGSALNRKAFRPAVKLGPAPPLPPVGENDTWTPIPAKDRDEGPDDFNWEKPKGHTNAARHFYKERRVSVNFVVSNIPKAMLYWLDTRVPCRRAGSVLAPQRSGVETTFVGHRYEIVIRGMKPKVVVILNEGIVEIKREGDTLIVVGAPLFDAPTHFAGNRWDTIAESQRTACKEVYKDFELQRAHFCSDKFDYRALNAHKFDYDDNAFAEGLRQTDARRLHLVQQASAFRPFTAEGFKLTSSSDALLAELASFVSRSRLQAYPEAFSWNNPVVSGRSVDAWYLPLSADLVQRVQLLAVHMLSQWSGLHAHQLEKVEVIGVQLYHHGAILREHTEPQSALTALFDVSRNDGADTEAWPLTFTDHSEKRHELTTNPGDIVLFETARVPMARLTPLPGREVALVAVHVTPGDWPQRVLPNGSQKQTKPQVASMRPATEPMIVAGIAAAEADPAHKESLANIASAETGKLSDPETSVEPATGPKKTVDEWEDFEDEDGSATTAETKKETGAEQWEDFRDEL